jgi:hypothetical protein
MIITQFSFESSHYIFDKFDENGDYETKDDEKGETEIEDLAGANVELPGNNKVHVLAKPFGKS